MFPSATGDQYDTPKNDQGWPQFCGKSNSSFWSYAQNIDSGVKAKMQPDWERVAPGYAYDTLATHEWPKHGTCFSV